MKKMKLLLALMLALPLGLKAQNIQITKFERNYTSLIARMNPVMDNAGEKCAVIRFYMRGTGYIIEPAQGVLKDSVMTGEVRMWVPKGTKRITIRHQDYMPLIGYDIPVRLESECDYDAWIEIRSQESGDKESGDKESGDKESGARSLEAGARSLESVDKSLRVLIS